MTTESDPIRQQQWAQAVRRSFGIPDLMSHEDARRTLAKSLEEELRRHGWLSATRAVADPMADALLTLGAHSDFDDQWLLTDPPTEAAHRLVANGLLVVDPEHLVFDERGEHPPEVVAVAQLALVRVIESAREHPTGLI